MIDICALYVYLLLSSHVSSSRSESNELIQEQEHQYLLQNFVQVQVRRIAGRSRRLIVHIKLYCCKYPLVHLFPGTISIGLTC